jgi:conjugal transfer ATP-binding protein TraC
MKVSIPQSNTNAKDNFLNIIAPSGIESTPNHLKIGDYYAKTLFVFTYPRTVSSGWLSPIINMPEMMDIAVYIHPMDTSHALRSLQRKVAQIEAELIEKEEKGSVRDPKLETAHTDVETLRDTLQQARERLFQVGVYITIYAPTVEELEKLEGSITSHFEGRLIYTKPALFQQTEGLSSVLPLERDKLLITTPMNSSPASSLFPFISPDLTSNEGILYGINMHNNGLIIFDRFSLENANSVVFAKSGSGKSYATKLEIIRSLMLGTDVIVIDPENEYKNLSDAIGGSYFKISLTSEHRINPFDIPIIPADEDPADVFKSHILNLTGLLKIMCGDVTPEEISLLDHSITETYASRDITPETFGQRDDLDPPLLSDLHTVLTHTKGGASLAMRLERFVSGSYAGFTNAPTNVDIKNRLIIFSIRDLEDELRPIAMYIILNFVWSLVRSKLTRRILVIDEAWWMMKYPDSALFLSGLVKRARKYYLGVTTITQDVSDFLDSPQGRPIINNSSLQLLLKQGPTSAGLVQKTFDLTEGEKTFLLEAKIGEGLFFAGTNHVAIKILPSPTEDQIITTDPEQLLEIKGLK